MARRAPVKQRGRGVGQNFVETFFGRLDHSRFAIVLVQFVVRLNDAVVVSVIEPGVGLPAQGLRLFEHALAIAMVGRNAVKREYSDIERRGFPAPRMTLFWR